MLVSESEGSYCLLGLVQGKVKTPEYIAQRIRAFMKDSYELVKNISDEEFQSHVNSLYVGESKKDENLNETVQRNWSQIDNDRYRFDQREKNCGILKECKKEEFIQFFEKYLKNEVAIVDSEFVSELHYEENEKIMKETQITEDDNVKKRVICDNVDDFKECNYLFPIETNPLYKCNMKE